MDINVLLAQPLVLPSLPRAVALLMSELAQPEPSLRRLNQFFGSDPALAARLLEEANSAAYGWVRQVNGIAQALALLDGAQLRTLVSSAPLGTTSGSVPGLNLQHFWRYSVSTAKIARSLAGLVHHDQIAAYTLGLLHGVGELVLHVGAQEQMQTLNPVVAPWQMRRAKLEKRLLGFNYAQVSAGLAKNWGLPQGLVDALNYHADPFDNDVYEPLAAVLHLAVWRARAREAGFDQRELAVSFPAEVGMALELDIDMVLQQDPIDWSADPDADAWT